MQSRPEDISSGLLFHLVPTAVFAVDRQRRIGAWNPAADGITGWRADEVVGRPCTSVMCEPCGESCGMFDPGRPVEMCNRSCSLRHRDGSMLQVLKNAQTIERDGRITGAVESFVDITALKRLEDELRLANAEAQAAMCAKSAFLVNMSHEIRTPMSGVLGMSELLLSTGLTAEQAEYAHTVYESAEALLGILDGILDFSKTDAERIRGETIPFDLHRMVFDVADLFRPCLRKGVELVVRLASDLPRRVLVDPGRLRQILGNLLGNAIKFSTAGHILVETVADGGQVRVAVGDTGIGISPEQLSRLFKPFAQADLSTTLRFGGTGLGLVISLRLAELLGGTIRVDSEPGKGLVFTLELALPSASGDREDVGAAPFARQRIMVVDDHALSTRVLVEQLSLFGAQAESEAVPSLALARLAQAAAEGQPFAATLLERDLPRLDGEAMVRTLRSDLAGAGVALVLLITSGMPVDAARLGSLGCNSYLVKPVRLEVLGEVIAAAIAMSHQRRTGLATRHSVAEMHPPAISPRLSRAARILLAEDNEVNRRLALIMLTRLGVTVSTVVDGAEAVALTVRKPFDLDLMDGQMPELDGCAATTAIRARELRTGAPRLRIIALTASAMPGDRERCLAAGMDGYLAKPVQERHLVAEIQRRLGEEST